MRKFVLKRVLASRLSPVLLAAGFLAAHTGAQVTLYDKTPQPVTAEDRAKMDRFVGSWSRADSTPDGLKVDYPYPTSEAMSLSHLQPWAMAEHDATEWDVDDTGAVCKRNGIFRQGIGTGLFTFAMVRSKDKLVEVGNIEESGPRDIFMNSPHPADLLPTWDGDSRGHFEGDTLVVDTYGFNDKSWIVSDRGAHSEELRVVEYMTLHDNGNYLAVRVIMDDRRAFKEPFTYLRIFKRGTGGAGGFAGPPPAAGQPAAAGPREEVCNQTKFGSDPWRRTREAILQDHEDELSAFIQKQIDLDKGKQ